MGGVGTRGGAGGASLAERQGHPRASSNAPSFSRGAVRVFRRRHRRAPRRGTPRKRGAPSARARGPARTYPSEPPRGPVVSPPPRSSSHPPEGEPRYRPPSLSPLRRRSRCCRRACSLARPPRPRAARSHTSPTRAVLPSCSSPSPSASPTRSSSSVARRAWCSKQTLRRARVGLARLRRLLRVRLVRRLSRVSKTHPRLPHRLLREKPRRTRRVGRRAGARTRTVTRDERDAFAVVFSRRAPRATNTNGRDVWNSQSRASVPLHPHVRVTPPRSRASRCRRRRGPRPSPPSSRPPRPTSRNPTRAARGNEAPPVSQPVPPRNSPCVPSP